MSKLDRVRSRRAGTSVAGAARLQRWESVTDPPPTAASGRGAFASTAATVSLGPSRGESPSSSTPVPATTATSAIPGTSTSAAVSKNQNAILDELWRLFLELERVRIITWRVLRDFMEKWPAAIVPLREWYKVTQCATWRSFADVKATFGQTDHARVKSGQTVCIFDIGGNKFRLVAFVSYAKGKVYVLRVMTHKEYGRANQRWKDEL